MCGGKGIICCSKLRPKQAPWYLDGAGRCQGGAFRKGDSEIVPTPNHMEHTLMKKHSTHLALKRRENKHTK